MHQATNEPGPDTFLLEAARQRESHFPMLLPHGIRAVPSDAEAVREFLKENFAIVFGDRPHRFTVPPERTDTNRLVADHHGRLHSEEIFFLDGDKPIGWCIGECQDAMTFYMRNTGFLPAYQGKGLYTAFLPMFLDYLADLGYERVTSQHKPDNPAVLIPKIRSGFVIMAVELEERWGPLVRLVYYTQGYRRDAFSAMVR
jgi:RimJ/RimL family protein N-acetyltransferase